MIKFDLPILQYERQSEKMEVEELMEKVDTEWKTIHGLLPKAVSGDPVFRYLCERVMLWVWFSRMKGLGGKASNHQLMATTCLCMSCNLRGVARPWTD